MVILLMGPSGAGKDTQAEFIIEKYGIPNISTGRIMRAEVASGSDLGKEIDSYVSNGKLLPDELTYELLKERVSKPDCKNGFILNGFPRTVNQIALLDQLLEEKDMKLTTAISFELPEEEIMRRMQLQRGMGEARPDMTDEAIQGRIDFFKNDVVPVIEKYEERGELLKIDGMPSIEEIRVVVAAELEKLIE